MKFCRAILIVFFILIPVLAFSQGETNATAENETSVESPAFGFTAAINLGVNSTIGADGNPESWNRLGFQPDISFGKLGLGLDLSMRFQLYPDPDTAVSIYPGDWIPYFDGSGKSVFDLYLAKIMYIRYGLRGEDPLYIKLGSIDDLSLGNGFIIGNYSNTLFMPDLRLFGLQAGMDGALFDFPYLGLDVVTGNLARFDVLGGRLYVRPLVTSEIPVFKDLQLGFSLVADLKPDLYAPTLATASPVFIPGADLFLPLISDELFPLAVFTDFVFQPHDRWGWMLGGAGRLVGVITYGAQLRVMGAGFIPVYFDANYDLFRSEKFDALMVDPVGSTSMGWFATLGLSLAEDILSLGVSMDGPFKPIPTVASTNPGEYPHLRAVAMLAPGVLGGFSFEFSYEKYYLGRDNAFFQELLSAQNAVIAAAINYHTGAAIISLIYDLRYNSETGDFDVTSSLQSTVKF